MFTIVTHSHRTTTEMSLMIDTQQVSYHTLYASEQSDLATALSCQNCIVAHDKGMIPMTMVLVMGVTSFVSRVSEKTAQHFAQSHLKFPYHQHY